ncbi:MAG: cell division protein FtsQ/DivIB [Lactococcus hircilactis]
MSEENNNRTSWEQNDSNFRPPKSEQRHYRGPSDRFSVSKFFNENLEETSQNTADETRDDHLFSFQKDDVTFSDSSNDRNDSDDTDEFNTFNDSDDFNDFETDFDRADDFEEINDESDENDAYEDEYDRFNAQNEARTVQEEIPEHPKPIPIYRPLLKKMMIPLFLAGLVFLISLYFITPISKIGRFSVSGNQNETSEQIALTSGLKTGDSIYSIYQHRKSINQKIEQKFPRIAQANIQFHFPNGIEMKIREHQTTAAVQQKNGTFLVLDNGYIVKTSKAIPAQTQKIPLLLDFSDQEVQTFIKAFETLTPSLRQLIQKVTKTPTDATKDFIALQMSDGNQVRVPLSQMSEKLPYYPSIAKQVKAPQVIDMEAGIYAKSQSDYAKDLSNLASEKAAAQSASTAKADANSSTQSSASPSTTQSSTSQSSSQTP